MEARRPEKETEWANKNGGLDKKKKVEGAGNGKSKPELVGEEGCKKLSNQAKRL